MKRDKMDWTVNVVVLLTSATLLPLIQPGLATDPVYSPATISDSVGNSADAASSVTWAALPTGDPLTTSEPERVTAGLEAYYSMVRGFINTIVFPKGLPDDIIAKVAIGDMSSITSEYQSYVSYFLGYAICTVLGILFILLFPIIGCCFCCCRCCGKCGGKRQQPLKDAGNKYKRNTFIVILLALLIMGVVGCVCVYINNGETSEAIKAFPESAMNSIDDIQIYANNTFDQATHIARTNFEFLKLALHRDLDNIAYLVGLPLRQDIEANTAILTALTTAYALDTKLTDANAALTDVDNNVTALKSSVTTLENAMNTVSLSLSNVFTACATCPVGAPVPDYATALSMTLDTNQFPDLTQPKADMATARSSNLTANVVDAETELSNIPETVANDSLSTRNSMKDNTNNLSDDIDPMIDQITDIKDLVNDNSDINTFKDDITEYGDMAKKYDKYRSYGGAGLAGFILLILVLAFLGVGFGVMGCDSRVHPNTRGCLSNTGGICLMASAGLIFIFSALFMLLTTLPFLLGAPLDRFVCQPITDTTFDTLEDMVDVQYNDAKEGTGKYFLGQMIFSNNTIDVTLSGLMRDCKKGESAYNAFKLSQQFDLDDILNYTKTLDVQAEIDAINVDLSSVNVYPATLQTQMADMGNAIDVNFTKFYEQLATNATSGDLSKLADDLDTYAASTGSPDDGYIQAEATNIRNIETTEYADVIAKMNALNASVAAMEAAVSNIPTMISTIDTGLNATNAYIQGTTPTVIITILNTYASRLLGIADSYVSYTLDAVKNKMGICTPVWNVYNSMLVYGFCYNLTDILNGFWFSLGWCVFFFIPSLIFSVKLAKYFRRMHNPDDKEGGFKMDDKERYYNGRQELPEVNQGPAKPIFPIRKNKVAHYDKEPW